MERTTRPGTGKTALHRDGTLTVWNCLRSCWMRGSQPSDALLATLSPTERDRVEAHVNA